MTSDPEEPSDPEPEASAAMRALREGLERVRGLVGKARQTLDDERRHEPAPPPEPGEGPVKPPE